MGKEIEGTPEKGEAPVVDLSHKRSWQAAEAWFEQRGLTGGMREYEHFVAALDSAGKQLGSEEAVKLFGVCTLMIEIYLEWEAGGLVAFEDGVDSYAALLRKYRSTGPDDSRWYDLRQTSRRVYRSVDKAREMLNVMDGLADAGLSDQAFSLLAAILRAREAGSPASR